MTPSTSTEPQAIHAADRSCYELRDGDEVLATIHYTRDGDTVRLDHTEVPTAQEGRGRASRLAAFALDDVRSKGLRVEPACDFVRGYIERHPEQRDLLA